MRNYADKKLVPVFLQLLIGRRLDRITEDVSHLRVDSLERFPLRKSSEAARVELVESGDEDRVQAVQVSYKLPEARLPREPAVHKQREAGDTEQGAVALAARKDVHGGPPEADVAHHAGRWQEARQGRTSQHRVQAVQQVVGSRQLVHDVRRVEAHPDRRLAPGALGGAVDMEGVKPLLSQGLFDLWIMEGRLQVVAAEDAVPEDPVPRAPEGVTGVNDVFVCGAGEHHVLETLPERGHLWVEEHLQGEALGRVLDQELVVRTSADLDRQTCLFG